jgi:hypothetical protein
MPCSQLFENKSLVFIEFDDVREMFGVITGLVVTGLVAVSSTSRSTKRALYLRAINSQTYVPLSS